ncbi:hypothetical protein FGG08_005887 [Glutinoglossum americanum]|uniref:DUF7924 domain-containing protein n=1 Tax=Glutinoglossum americanum TaxID=1670608 RepID=A0A9P8I2D2_9PEZI|nr:hypothetical protein FGG08_005887 [Glutinoglossum americanum]
MAQSQSTCGTQGLSTNGKLAVKVNAKRSSAYDPNFEQVLIDHNIFPDIRCGGALVDARPDLYDGTLPERIDKRVRERLRSYIMLSTHSHTPCLPNLFAEGKGPNGCAAVAKRQACYDGALGARGIRMLQSFGTDAGVTFDNNAYTITSSYHCGTSTLQIDVHNLSYQPKAPGGEPEYYMIQLRSFAMTDTPETFRQGARAFRNARDWTMEQRDKLVGAVNGRVTDTPTEAFMLEPPDSPSAAEPTLLESNPPPTNLPRTTHMPTLTNF